MNRKFLLCLFLVAGLCSATTAQAEIVFGPVTTLAADTDVSLNGDLEYAYSFAPAQATVTLNTVPFVSGQLAGFTNVLNAANFAQADDVTTTSLNQILNAAFNGNSAPPVGSTYESLSADYQTFLGGAAFGPGTATTGDVTLGNLTAGQDYEVQLWLNDSRNITNARVATVTSGANSVTLAYNSNDAIPDGPNPNNNGGVGQFVIGAFTATAATETFTLSVPDGQGGLQINAVQVRNVGGSAVILGDVNLDGVVNFLDITPFIGILSGSGS
jgi:hypothetical protein